MELLKLRQIPNALTLMRCVLALPMAGYLLQERYGPALVLFVIAGISDGLDGFLAKHFGWQSRFGSIADPLADKLLLLAGFSALVYTGVLPLWLLLLVLGRDLLIVSGAYAYHRLFGPFEMQPSLLSKANTLAQILFLSLLLLQLAGVIQLDTVWLLPATIAVAALTVLSGLHYVWLWSRKTRQRLPMRKP